MTRRRCRNMRLPASWNRDSANWFPKLRVNPSRIVLPAEERVMRTRCHEKQHWQGEPCVRTRREKRLTCQRRGIRRRCAGERTTNDLFVVPPDDSPDVHHHEQPNAAADSDREHMIVGLSDRSVGNKEPACQAD